MPQQVQSSFNFVKGFNTESSALTYPPDTCVDIDNFVLNKDGSIQRRLGVGYENNYSLTDSGSNTDQYYSYHVWDNVNNDSTFSIGIYQIGAKLYFLDLREGAPSANLLDCYDLGTGADDHLWINHVSDFSGVSQIGYFLITAAVTLGLTTSADWRTYLSFDKANNRVEWKSYRFKVRDFFGYMEDSVSDRPSTLTNKHIYNLVNMGWTKTHVDVFYTGTTPNVYPALSDIVWTGFDDAGTFTAAKVLAASGTSQTDGGETARAPYGKAILDMSTMTDSRLSVLVEAGYSYSDLVSSTEKYIGIPNVIESFQGRTFLAGFDSNSFSSVAVEDRPSYDSLVFFTRLVSKEEDFGKFYSEASPTSKDISDIVATDGGFIELSETYNIVKLLDIGSALLVFAENGVWAVSGTDSIFTATSYKVEKITDIGTTSTRSIVNVEGTAMYWSEGGIYSIQSDSQTGRVSTVNMTTGTIVSYYNNLSDSAIENCHGIYDKTQKIVKWLFNTESSYSGMYTAHNSELSYDLALGSYYKHNIDDSSAVIRCYAPTKSFVVTDVVSPVTVGGAVVTASAVTVTTTNSIRSNNSQTRIKYGVSELVSSTWNITLAHFKDSSFLDWSESVIGGVDYTSNMITGWNTQNDSMRYKQVPYITFHFTKTEDGFEEIGGELYATNQSSCIVSPRWDFATLNDTGKIGSSFEAYRFTRNYIPTGVGDTFDYGYDVITTKNKLRGRGRALSLNISSSTGKDMRLLGWSMLVSGGSQV